MSQQVARIEHEHGPPLAFSDFSLDVWQTRFLQAYSEVGSVQGAGRQSKVHPSYHYRWMKENSEYSLAYGLARDIYGDIAEGAIRQRGIEGYKRELHYKGKLTGDKTTEYSDVLALAVMKALKAEYRDGNQIAIGPAKISIEITSPQIQGSTEQNTEIVIQSAELDTSEN